MAVKAPENVLKSAPIEPTLKPAPSAVQTPTFAAPPVAAQTQANPVAAAPTPSRNVAPPSNSVAKSELVAIRTPDPSFPSDALNRGLSGAVEVEFIVQRSGEVSEVRVVNSSQRAFDRNVVTTVKRWKFAPLAEPMTVRRSFNFNNPS
jgi:protein TonB